MLHTFSGAALVTSVVGYVSMKEKDGWLEKIQLRLKASPVPEPQSAYALQETTPRLPKAQPAVAVAAVISESEAAYIA